MKNKISKILICIILLVTSFSLIYIPVNADSGWDTDYDFDYDSGWDSGSDWDSDYDYDSSWGGGSYSSASYSGGFSWLTAVIIVIIIIVIIYNTTNKNNKNRPNSGGGGNISNKSNNYQDIDVSKISEIDKEMNINEFKNKVFNIYRDLQTAWMNFDTNTIRKLTTDEIYNMYSSQLETLKLKKQKNIMTDITLDEVKVIDIKEQNNIITTSVYLRVKCYDYVIKETTNELVRGRDKDKIVIEYVLSFVKSAINNSKEEKCPNCGAKVEINASSTCPYCDSVLVKDASDYVMSKKTCVGQYLERR